MADLTCITSKTTWHVTLVTRTYYSNANHAYSAEGVGRVTMTTCHSNALEDVLMKFTELLKVEF